MQQMTQLEGPQISNWLYRRRLRHNLDFYDESVFEEPQIPSLPPLHEERECDYDVPNDWVIVDGNGVPENPISSQSGTDDSSNDQFAEVLEQLLQNEFVND
jgi:hypothetical protein